jgi:prophage maintenance system killer protein
MLQQIRKQRKFYENIELRALKYFCYIARTQMFIDGNKRVAQLMVTKVVGETFL